LAFFLLEAWRWISAAILKRLLCFEVPSIPFGGLEPDLLAQGGTKNGPASPPARPLTAVRQNG
jgi:hypothetical protein